MAILKTFSTNISSYKEGEARNMIGQKIKVLAQKPCQRILLIHPMHIPEDNFYIDKALNKRYWSYQPYGCGVLCYDLENRGYETDILDLNFEVLYSAQLNRDNFEYSVWQERLSERLKQFRPDLIGISCMFTISHGVVKQIAREIKRYQDNIVIIGGGVHPSNARKLVLEDCPDIDFIGAYECDKSLPDLIDFINGKLEIDKLTQLATLINGEYIGLDTRAVPSSNEIEAIPQYHSLPINKYDEVGQIGSYLFMRRGRKAASVLSNRGCRAHCSFCSVAEFNGPSVRQRSIDSVMSEIRELHEKYGVNHITWLDDDLLFNKERALELFNRLATSGIDLTWDASNGLIAAFITPELMKAMVDSGCVGFNLGIESGSPEILRAVHKPGTVNSFRKAKILIDQYPHIFIKGFLMLGFPGETMQQLMNTVNLGLELCFDWYSIQLLNPLPSTEIYQDMLEQGIIKDSLEISEAAYVFGPHGKQRRREEDEKNSAKEFFNLFIDCGPEDIPTKEQLTDCWFLMDYKLNYAKVEDMTDPIKLRKASLVLSDVGDRIAPENPLAHLFMGLAEYKLNNFVEAKKRADMARKIVNESAYWKTRFKALQLERIMDPLQSLGE